MSPIDFDAPDLPADVLPLPGDDCEECTGAGDTIRIIAFVAFMSLLIFMFVAMLTTPVRTN